MRETGKGYRVVGDLAVTDRIMRDTFWIGVYPGMSKDMMHSVLETIQDYCKK